MLAAAAEHVWSVDRLPSGPAAAEVARLGTAGAVTLVVGDYTDPANAPPDPVDVVFIDGAHHAEAVVRNLNLAVEVLAANGPVAVHDYGDPNAPDVAVAADAWAATNGWVMVNKAGTLAVYARP